MFDRQMRRFSPGQEGIAGPWGTLADLPGLLFVRADKGRNMKYEPLTATAWENSTKSGTGTIDWCKVFGVPRAARSVLVYAGGYIGTVRQIANYGAGASRDLTLTTSFQDVPGATVTLVEEGTYQIIGVFDFQGSDALDDTALAIGQLEVDGVPSAREAHYTLRIDMLVGERATISVVWGVTTTGANKVAKLRAKKTSGTGASYTYATHTNIRAIRLSDAAAGHYFLLAANAGYTFAPVQMILAGANIPGSITGIVPIANDGTSYYVFDAAFDYFVLRVVGWWL